MRVDVLSSVEKTKTGKLFQVLGVFYPMARLPVEARMWLQQDSDQLPPGQYMVEVEKCIENDKQSNRPTIWFRPEALISTAIRAAAAAPTKAA